MKHGAQAMPKLWRLISEVNDSEIRYLRGEVDRLQTENRSLQIAVAAYETELKQ